MTALDIMNQARERLGDLKKQRWSDNRLLSIISQGQVDICVESGYLRKTTRLPLVLNRTIFTLPSDCVSIKRVEYQGDLLPLHTRSDQDNPRAITSDYTAYKSNLNMNKLEVIPAISEYTNEIIYAVGDLTEDSLFVADVYGVVSSTSNSELLVDPIYGVTTGVDLESDLSIPSTGHGEIAGSSLDKATIDFTNTEYGVVVDADYTYSNEKYGFIAAVEDHEVRGTFGLIGNISYQDDTILVYYVSSPAKLKFLGEVLVLPEIWEDILMRYVVGTALQDDNDANNITRGEAELQKYGVKLDTIKDLSSKDFSSSSSDKFETNFRRV